MIKRYECFTDTGVELRDKQIRELMGTMAAELFAISDITIADQPMIAYTVRRLRSPRKGVIAYHIHANLNV